MNNKWKGCGFFAMRMIIFKKILAQPRTAVSFLSSSVPRHPVGSGARPVVVLRGGFGRSEWSKAPFSASSSAPSSKIFISKLKNQILMGRTSAIWPLPCRHRRRKIRSSRHRHEGRRPPVQNHRPAAGRPARWASYLGGERTCGPVGAQIFQPKMCGASGADQLGCCCWPEPLARR